jgi:peptidoglycan biosynthesis protein MviN/MurJ (putative lipid II flippase)
VILVALSTFVLTLALIPPLGLAGAATANAAGTVISACLLVVLARTKLCVRL